MRVKVVERILDLFYVDFVSKTIPCNNGIDGIGVKFGFYDVIITYDNNGNLRPFGISRKSEQLAKCNFSRSFQVMSACHDTKQTVKRGK